MNLLAFLVGVGCLTALGIAVVVPDEVWDAIAERIRNPRPSAMEELHRHWEAMDAMDRRQPIMWTPQQIEDMDEIAHELINWCLEAEGNVPWLDDLQRAAVKQACQIVEAEQRYHAVLDIIEDTVNNQAAADILNKKGDD